jgi:hypothetical protein
MCFSIKTMTLTVDFIGTTYSTRFDIDSSTAFVSEASEQLCTIDELRFGEERDLPAMKALMDLGANFSVHRGCPMLRVHDVPEGPVAQQWLQQLADVEFGSTSMWAVVRNAFEAHADAADAGLPEQFDNIADAVVAEWDDAPLCAMVTRARTAAELSEGKSSTEMLSFGFQPVTAEQCSFECGKRLNRSVAAMLKHFGLGADCFSLFTGPEETTIELTKVHGYTECYRDLFSCATTICRFDETDDSFRARERGLFVFAMSAKIVQQALSIVDAVVKQQLAPALAWRFECERIERSPIVRPHVTIAAWSVADLEKLMNDHDCTNVRAVLLTATAKQQGDTELLAKLLQPIVQQLCLLMVTHMKSLPAAFFENILVANPSIVVCWHHADPRVVIPVGERAS